MRPLKCDSVAIQSQTASSLGGGVQLREARNLGKSVVGVKGRN